MCKHLLVRLAGRTDYQRALCGSCGQVLENLNKDGYYPLVDWAISWEGLKLLECTGTSLDSVDTW